MAAIRRSQANASDAPAPGGHAVDRGNDRLAHRAQGADDRVVALPELLVERRGVRSLALRQVLAGAEGATRTGQDHRADGAVGSDPLELPAQGDLEPHGQGIERLRAIQRERRDRPVDVDAQAVGHPLNSTSRPSTISNTRRSMGSSAPPDCSTMNSANIAANPWSFGRRLAAVRRCRSGMPTSTRAPSVPSSWARCAMTSGQQDPDRVQSVARVGADQAPLAGDLVRPGSGSGPGREVAQGGVLELYGLDPP